jgi:pyroglutamyl-peptidase
VKTVLVTGFGPFPGAPKNPTMAIVRHLVKCRNGAFSTVERIPRYLPTTWHVLSEFRQMIASIKPDAILMFGVAGRRKAITPETRAINRACMIRCDADGCKPSGLMLQAGEAAFRHGRFDVRRLTASLTRAGLAARVSHDAGDYLCNALFWVALESGVPSLFVHVPSPRRAQRPKRPQKTKRPSARDLARAGEVTLAMVAASSG